MERLGPLVRVRTVEPITQWVVRVTFDNGIQRDVDLEPYLHGPIFEPIRKSGEEFGAMRVEGGTIAWPNGADIDPDVLYYNLTPAAQEQAVQ